MYDLMKIPPILYHLQLISKGMFVDKGSHFMMFCPFCDDATRKINPNHGHCYTSKTLPVYYCHRCNSAGTILKLLIYTDFEDNEVLNYLKSFMKYNFVKDYLFENKSKYSSSNLILYKNILQKVKNVDSKSLKIFNNYIYYRLGSINYIKFLLYPTFIQLEKINNKILCVGYNNSFNEFVGGRLIQPVGKIRYTNNPNSWYFFQRFNFDGIQNIVITEGMFDLLNLYLYNNFFEAAFFLSISGKNYLSVIESLIIQELLIGNFTINLILDNDNLKNNYLKHKVNKLIEILNNNINVRFWKPCYTKDVGEFPTIEELI